MGSESNEGAGVPGKVSRSTDVLAHPGPAQATLSTPMKTSWNSLLLSLALVSLTGAAEPQPLLTTTGKAIVTEDFSGADIPKTFRTLESAASFSIVDGALQAVSRGGQESSTHGVFTTK